MLGVVGGFVVIIGASEVILIDAVESIELNLPFTLPAGDVLALTSCLGEVMDATRDRGVVGGS